MKKMVITLVCIFCLFDTAFAQEMTVGLRLGSNMSTLKGDYEKERSREITDYSRLDPLPLSYGLFFNYRINKNLSTQFEINSRTKRMYYSSKQGLIGADWGVENLISIIWKYLFLLNME